MDGMLARAAKRLCLVVAVVLVAWERGGDNRKSCAPTAAH